MTEEREKLEAGYTRHDPPEGLREAIAKLLFADDIVHGHLQYWESPTENWDEAPKNLKEAYFRFADSILSLLPQYEPVEEGEK